MRRRGRVATGDAANYREKKKADFDGECERCGEPADWDEVQVHHVDRDRSNDDDDNLEAVCHDCHNDEHHGDSPLWGVMVEVPRPVLDLVDTLVEERGYASRHEAINRAVIGHATPDEEDRVPGFSTPSDSVSAWFGDARHTVWARDGEVER